METNIVNDPRYLKSRENLVLCCIPENLVSDRDISQRNVPDKYKLSQKIYRTSPDCWNYCELVISFEDGTQMSVKRNYSDIDFIYCVQNGKEFILTGEDYQGMTSVNLTDHTVNSFVPDSKFQGVGWCITDFCDWDEEENRLKVEGCYWACPYYIRRYTLPDLDHIDMNDFIEEDDPDFSDYEDSDDESEDEELEEKE